MKIETITDKNRKRPSIKPEQLVPLVLAGQPVVCGEYRGTACQLIEWNDKTTGKPDSFLKIAHTVELTKQDGTLQTIAVEERAPKDFKDANLFVAGLRKGQQIICKIASMLIQKGNVTATCVDAEDGILVLESVKA